MEKELKEYIERELEKPVNYEHYNPDGNSSRAVIARGFYKEVLKRYRDYPSRLLFEIKQFNGFDTP